uniref:Uncharacterized protein n=1 Tax=Oryza rufipogon TaxID=4529 RepID=A0A0E0QUY6_ORYRU
MAASRPQNPSARGEPPSRAAPRATQTPSPKTLTPPLLKPPREETKTPPPPRDDASARTPARAAASASLPVHSSRTVSRDGGGGGSVWNREGRRGVGVGVGGGLCGLRCRRGGEIPGCARARGFDLKISSN